MLHRVACLLVCLLPLQAVAAPDQVRARPNVVFILADDLGWPDLRTYGSEKYLTPNLDAMASRGVRFTDAYAAGPVCSPTRSSIMTGKYPARNNLTNWLGAWGGPRFLRRLPLAEVTIAESLKHAGYATALIGKWHLGDTEYGPKQQGFDVAVGAPHGGRPWGGYYLPNEMDLPGADDGEYLTDYLTDAGIEFIEANRDKPFFLYQSYYSVHAPVEGRLDLVAAHEARAVEHGIELNPHYAAMIQSLDEGVGRILSTLDRLELTNRTFVVFFSDNGGFTHAAGRKNDITDNSPLRMGKGFLYEGGVRTPLIVQYPPLAAAGGVSPELVVSTDFYPTILDIAGIDAMPEQHADGTSLAPLLADPAARLSRRAIYFHSPHPNRNGGTPASAVRSGEFKLIEFLDSDRLELYDLDEDIGETTNLADALPAKAAEMRAMLSAWRRSVDAQMPRRGNRAATATRERP